MPERFLENREGFPVQQCQRRKRAKYKMKAQYTYNKGDCRNDVCDAARTNSHSKASDG